MPEHSCEPWELDEKGGQIRDAEGGLILDALRTCVGHAETIEDWTILRRIVACVNFCKGVILNSPAVTLDDLLAAIIESRWVDHPLVVRRQENGWSIGLEGESTPSASV